VTVASREGLADPFAHPDMLAFGAKMDQKYGRANDLGALAHLAFELSPSAAEIARSRNANIIGKVALEKNVRVSEVAEDRPRDLALLVEQASEGNEIAEKQLEADASSEVVEMIIKSGGVMKAYAHFNHAGEVVQFGKTTAERQANTLRTFAKRLPALQAMAHAEGNNGLVFEELHKRGLTRGKRMVEFSLIPAHSRAALADSGLFLREAIGIIRTTEAKPNGTVEFTSYLVGGTDQDALPSFNKSMSKADEAAIEDQALANRFDIPVVRKMYQRLGIPNATTMTSTELLATPLMVPDTVDGIDFAMMYDQVASEITGKKVMMGLGKLYRETANSGQALNRIDYEAQAKKSLLLQNGLQAVGKEVAQELVLWRHKFGRDAYKAGRLLHTIAEFNAVKYVADNSQSYDTTVFGLETHLRLLRRQNRLEAGDVVGADRELYIAQQAARGTGCPGGGRNSLTGSAETDINSDEYGSLSFECPNSECKKTNTRDPGNLKSHCDYCHEAVPGC
jgi:hypothetical protein